ncbi:hypothetical protein ELI36_19110 [Rhizobium ruizarguesonis]|uniref:hypothetical protein n=1 Tax=Rhizobium ruizarguesonis TaxID=2081791 RepID=UPI00102F3D5A|nr:hypothetical protein [Rhizobium ruizarguesonis]TAV34392.1 hypothetical protein ELI36_19110 [Rhizobium ruizarguesonis]
MAEKEFTLAAIKAAASNPTPVGIMLDMALSETHEERLALVERAIDYIAQELVKNRHVQQDKSEDALTIDIVSHLRTMGFQASHDTQYGGHCDVVVEARDEFLWIAEAKKHTSYDWLLGGFEQLDRRYSTGLSGQDSGEMIIYCFGARLDKVMAEYQIRLTERRPDVAFEVAGDNAIVLRSTHAHENTGRPFRVRHKGIPLYFKPTV